MGILSADRMVSAMGILSADKMVGYTVAWTDAPKDDNLVDRKAAF